MGLHSLECPSSATQNTGSHRRWQSSAVRRGSQGCRRRAPTSSSRPALGRRSPDLDEQAARSCSRDRSRRHASKSCSFIAWCSRSTTSAAAAAFTSELIVLIAPFLRVGGRTSSPFPHSHACGDHERASPSNRPRRIGAGRWEGALSAPFGPGSEPLRARIRKADAAEECWTSSESRPAPREELVFLPTGVSYPAAVWGES